MSLLEDIYILSFKMLIIDVHLLGALAGFQDVFPARFGDKYCEDIQMLVEIFLLQLDKLLTVPNLKEVTYLF